jgi:hypothetical protein
VVMRAYVVEYLVCQTRQSLVYAESEDAALEIVHNGHASNFEVLGEDEVTDIVSWYEADEERE